MNPTKLKLTNPTDDELSGAVAVYIVGTPTGYDYAATADAVLPLLDGFEWVDIGKDVDYNDGPWAVSISRQRAGAMGALFIGSAPALPRAACIALLRANGIEVEITPQPAQK